MSQMTLLTGPERRRRWSEDERRLILAAAFAPGAIVADISRRYEISTSLIYKWRRQTTAAESGAAFAPAILVNRPASGAPGAGACTGQASRAARATAAAWRPAALRAARWWG